MDVHGKRWERKKNEENAKAFICSFPRCIINDTAAATRSDTTECIMELVSAGEHCA